MPSADPFEPGLSIGPYKIVKELGRGGMGRVYLAEDTVEARLVAVKVIVTASHDETEAAHARFLHEVRNLGRLDHPNIVTIHTTGNHAGHPYFVMQYIPGRDLARFVDECATFDDRERLERIVRVVMQVARAVQYAHEKSIVHRDLKPANILIRHEGDLPMILDFGIARCLDDTNLTKGPESPGTPAYRAPEQLDVTLKVRDELIDVWALGVILYRLLTGVAPFKGYDLMSLSLQILNVEPPSPRQVNRQIPVAIERVILACLHKHPAHRPASASMVADLLQRFLDESRGSSDRPRPGRVAHIWESVRTTLRDSSFDDTPPRRLIRRVAFVVVPIGFLAAAIWTARHVLVTPSSANDMVTVPAGPFMMGCNRDVDDQCDPGEDVAHTVVVPAFQIDRTEVSVEAYRHCVDAGVCRTEGLTTPFSRDRDESEQSIYCNWKVPGREHHPINCLSLEQARSYCAWAGKRLPREEEWEKAARGADGRKYPWGNADYRAVEAPVANVADMTAQREFPQEWDAEDGFATAYDDGYAATAPVDAFGAGESPSGAVNMVGNVWEWVEETSDGHTVVRGGSWYDRPTLARASSRSRVDRGSRLFILGMRCAR